MSAKRPSKQPAWADSRSPRGWYVAIGSAWCPSLHLPEPVAPSLHTCPQQHDAAQAHCKPKRCSWKEVGGMAHDNTEHSQSVRPELRVNYRQISDVLPLRWPSVRVGQTAGLWGSCWTACSEPLSSQSCNRDSEELKCNLKDISHICPPYKDILSHFCSHYGSIQHWA